MEIIRRVILLIGLLAAITVFLLPEPVLLRVEAIDFEAMRKRSFFDKNTPMDQYIQQKTENRLATVSGPEWAAFFDTVANATAGGAVDATLAKRQSKGWSAGTYLYYRPDEAPMNTIAADLDRDRKPFLFVTITNEADPRYLGVDYQTPYEAKDTAPTGMLYPYRRFSLWFALFTIAVYVALPWPKYDKQDLHYSRVRAVILPDLVGCILAGVFYALPLFIVPNASSSANIFDFEGGWAYLTIIFWLFALSGVTILSSAVYYATYYLRILPDGLRVGHILGSTDYYFSEMAGVYPYVQRAPRWLRNMGLIALLLPGRMNPSPLLALYREDEGMNIVCKDGRKIPLLLEYMSGLRPLLLLLQERGVFVEPSLLSEEEDDDE